MARLTGEEADLGGSFPFSAESLGLGILGARRGLEGLGRLRVPGALGGRRVVGKGGGTKGANNFGLKAKAPHKKPRCTTSTMPARRSAISAHGSGRASLLRFQV